MLLFWVFVWFGFVLISLCFIVDCMHTVFEMATANQFNVLYGFGLLSQAVWTNWIELNWIGLIWFQFNELDTRPMSDWIILKINHHLNIECGARSELGGVFWVGKESLLMCINWIYSMIILDLIGGSNKIAWHEFMKHLIASSCKSYTLYMCCARMPECYYVNKIKPIFTPQCAANMWAVSYTSLVFSLISIAYSLSVLLSLSIRFSVSRKARVKLLTIPGINSSLFRLLHTIFTSCAMCRAVFFFYFHLVLFDYNSLCVYRFHLMQLFQFRAQFTV